MEVAVEVQLPQQVVKCPRAEYGMFYDAGKGDHNRAVLREG